MDGKKTLNPDRREARLNFRLKHLATSFQNFFVSKDVSGLRPSDLPLSSVLSSALKKLRIKSLADLGNISVKDFQIVSGRSSELVAELGEMIQRARTGEFASVARPKPQALQFFRRQPAN